MFIIDTHAHLDHLGNLDQALKEAWESGVEGIVTVGVDLSSNQKNLEIKETVTSPRIYVGLGIHPGNIKAEEIEPGLAFIRENIHKAHAVGETGLDFWYKRVRKDKEKKDQQRQVFQGQCELAREFDLPVVIHSRGTWRECLDTARAMNIKNAVFHWYSGPLDVLEEILACGYFISATPSLAYSPPAQEAVKHAPIQQILIETDSPVYYRDGSGQDGFSSRPRDVFKTLRLYAGLKDLDQEKVLDVLNNNARAFFRMKTVSTSTNS